MPEKYFACWSLPGCLPEMEPYDCGTLENGKIELANELETELDSIFNRLDRDDPESRQEAAQLIVECRQAIRDAKTDGYAIYNNYVYFVIQGKE